MSTPTSAMIYLCRDPADAGDLIQPVGRHLERGDLGLDLAVEGGDVGAGLVDARHHGLQQEGVMVGEAADEGLLPLLLRRADRDQVNPIAGQVPQPVGLGPAGQVLGRPAR
jgi:hypothetical protein